MRSCPEIGQRVHFLGNSVTGACVGVVEAIYPLYEEERPLVALPEEAWHVRFRPDVMPARWPYNGYNVFAPEVRELTSRYTTHGRDEDRQKGEN